MEEYLGTEKTLLQTPAVTLRVYTTVLYVPGFGD